jgi:hypothetical protein
MLLALMLLAAPPPCEALWPTVWKSYAEKELSKGTPPLFEKFPDAKQRLEKAWLTECRAFDKATLDCAKGVTREAEFSEIRRNLTAQKLPPEQIEALIKELRAEWTPLQCKEVDRSLDRAGAAAAKAQ